MNWGRWDLGLCGVEDVLNRTEAQAQILADHVLPVEAVGGAHHLANAGDFG